MRRQARSTQSGVQGSPPVGPDAKRRVTRLGRRPRPSRLRCRGCAQALKASGRHVRSAEARGQGPRRRARGASDLTLRRSGLPSLPSFARPAGRAGNRSRPALPLGSSPRASLDDAPPCLGPLRPRERRRTPSRHQWRRAMTAKLQATADAFDTSRLDAALEHTGRRRGVAELVDAAPRLHQAGLSARPSAEPHARRPVPIHRGRRAALLPAGILPPRRDLPGRRRPALLPRRPGESLAGAPPVVDDDLRRHDRGGVRAGDAPHGQPLRPSGVGLAGAARRIAPQAAPGRCGKGVRA